MASEPLDLDAIAARANHARGDREIASDALVDVPALIARVREQEQEIARLKLRIKYLEPYAHGAEAQHG